MIYAHVTQAWSFTHRMLRKCGWVEESYFPIKGRVYVNMVLPQADGRVKVVKGDNDNDQE